MKVVPIALMLVAGCAGVARTEPSSRPVDQSAKLQRATEDAMPASIGSATMKADGTIVLMLRAEAETLVGDSVFESPPNHPEYEAVLKHVGGLRPGEAGSAMASFALELASRSVFLLSHGDQGCACWTAPRHAWIGA